jgi:lipoate synthase
LLGLGERPEELLRAFDDLRAHDVTVLTLGQYLRPTPKHLPVVEFIHPDTCGSAASQTRLQTRGMESPVAVHASKSIIRAKTFSFARG